MIRWFCFDCACEMEHDDGKWVCPKCGHVIVPGQAVS